MRWNQCAILSQKYTVPACYLKHHEHEQKNTHVSPSGQVEATSLALRLVFFDISFTALRDFQAPWGPEVLYLPVWRYSRSAPSSNC